MKYLLLGLLSLTIFSACSQSAKNLDAKSFKDLITKTPNAIVVDVRTDAEVVQGVIPKAIQIDYNSQNFEAQIAKLDKSKPVFVYCAVGGRSSGAASIMQQKGFKQVYNLAGGINAWRMAGYPTTTIKR